MSAARRKGTAAETAIVRVLQANGFPDAERRALHGQLDKGDVLLPGMGVVIEVKNCVTLKLAEWVAEARQEAINAQAVVYAVWHKRKGTTDPLEWYVTMPGAMFVRLLEGQR